ncbi:UDP-3-O-acyl-N-acetylglucosamine deacetylase [Thiomicrorhabdus sp. zzn3]|uniref:UDP-3-O-acyl-N-acetylglucosamine deacetylase n=1 Tax=Thiomicrorhabdus sp. zzn3 TaxID=3039775 RepID=UPI0024365007|nr:UDP-3-O-acyl-N-acetylglucosamine deacetylase [Thiomicrorhabdus sp. zzn3]MDG6778482.1 UDP-3-O-acyl-N-acetylglucosamine deacetylase [Thiomicrorhabdus sp. zzn3]
MNQRTLANQIKAKGIGLHTGHESIMTLRPAPVDTGIVFRRIDQDPAVEFKVSPEIVGETMLCTTIVSDQPQGRIKIATIEHLMSALAGVGIDNVYIDIDSDEVPIMDGSSSHFIFLLQSAGINIQDAPKRFIRILKPIRVENDKGGSAEFSPYDGFRLNFSIDFDHPAFSATAEKMTLEFSSTSYFKEVSRARTFGFMKDMEMLRQKNLALGASLDNAIGLDDKGVMNVEGLRNKDEFVRHKILDAVGDLYMIGHPIIGEFTAHKSGHALNNQLLRSLKAQPDAYEIVSFEEGPAPVHFGSSKILV